MEVYIESLKRLYENKTITIAKVKELLKAGKITVEEQNYIIGKGKG